MEAMTVLTLLILYICATAIATPPTLPIPSLQNDAKSPDLNATPSSVLAGPTSQLNNIPSHLTKITTNPLPPFSLTLRLNTVVGSITFGSPHYTSYGSSLLEVFAAAAVAARSQENTTFIRDPLSYTTEHATLVLRPIPALTWQVWKEAVVAMFLYNRLYWGATYFFRIHVGNYEALVASGRVMTE